MNNLVLYILQVTFVFSVLYILYIVFLDRLTFHRLNRFVLLLLLPVSLIIPFSNNLLPSIASKIIEVPLFEYLNSTTVNEQLQTIESPLVAATFNYSSFLIIIYWVVFIICILRILGTTRHLFILKSSSIIQKKNGYKVIISNVGILLMILTY